MTPSGPCRAPYHNFSTLNPMSLGLFCWALLGGFEGLPSSWSHLDTTWETCWNILGNPDASRASSVFGRCREALMCYNECLISPATSAACGSQNDPVRLACSWFSKHGQEPPHNAMPSAQGRL